MSSSICILHMKYVMIITLDWELKLNRILGKEASDLTEY